MVQLIILFDRVEVRQRIPNTGNFDSLWFKLAEHRIIFAIRLTAIAEIITPRDTRLVQQVSQVSPGVIVMQRVHSAGRTIQGIHTALRVAGPRAPR